MVVYIMEEMVLGVQMWTLILLPIEYHLYRNDQPKALNFKDINIVLCPFNDQKINVRRHNQPYTVILTKPKIFSFYLKNIQLQEEKWRTNCKMLLLTHVCHGIHLFSFTPFYSLLISSTVTFFFAPGL